LASSREGFEYHLLILVISAALLVVGGGKWAIGSLIARSLARQAEPAPARLRHAA